MNTERHHASLKNALSQLPVYSPAAENWEAIERNLDSPEERKPDRLTQAVRQLPSYAAPAGGWRQLARQLPMPRRWRYGWAAAAAVLILALAGTWLALPPEQRLPLSERHLKTRPELPIPEPAHFEQVAPLLVWADSCYARQEGALPPEAEAQWAQLMAERARYDSLAALPASKIRFHLMSELEIQLRGRLFQLEPWLCQSP
ncbi:MAG: hypothetical protein D6722_13465 [Bacteroidetes bacterium]|nr:MAG: hypothetical protein D6722_13465 [Bacteroidota bacterium]